MTSRFWKWLNRRWAYYCYAFFRSTADSLVANNLVLAIYRHTLNAVSTSCVKRLKKQFTLPILYRIFRYGWRRSLQREIPSVARKASWGLKYTQVTLLSTLVLLKTTNVYFVRILLCTWRYLLLLWLYSSMGRRNKMNGVAEQFQYIMNLCTWTLVSTWLTKSRFSPLDCRVPTRSHSNDSWMLEIEYARDTMPRGVLGMAWWKSTWNSSVTVVYLSYRAICWCNQSICVDVWDDGKEKNFFETRVTDYQTGGAGKFRLS